MGKTSKKRQTLPQADMRETGNPPNRQPAKVDGSEVSLIYKPAVHLALIGLLGLLLYSNTFHSPFQWDEADFIVGNPIVRDLGYFTDTSRAESLPIYSGLKSRYIGYLSFALNYKLNGFDVFGYHLVNLVIHIINAALVYFLVLLTLRTPYFGAIQPSSSQVVEGSSNNSTTQQLNNKLLTLTYSRLFAFAVALLFVSHPVQTEAVTYVFQRFASLVTMFYLLSLVLYIKGRLKMQRAKGKEHSATTETPQRAENKEQRGKNAILMRLFRGPMPYALCSLLSAVLAMKTKENAFTLPLIITLYEFLFLSGPVKARLIRLLPLLLTMLIIPMTMIGLDSTAGEIVSAVKDPASLGFEGLSGKDYLFTQFRVIITYIRLLFLPVNQNLDYDYPIYRSFFAPPVFLSFLVLAFFFGTAGYLVYKSQLARGIEHSAKSPAIHYSLFAIHCLRLIAFGILWFFITLSVESSIIPIPTLIDEYRVYLPSAGFFLALVAGVFVYMDRFAAHGAKNTTRFAFFALLILVLTLSAATFARNNLWKDRVSLWEDIAAKSPGSRRVLNNLGLAYAEKGWQEKAISMYRRCIVLDPSFPLAYVNLGVAYARTGQTAMAIENLEKAVALAPENVSAYANLARAYGEAGRLDEAAENYSKVIALRPGDGAAYQGLGTAYVMLGRLDDALIAYTRFVILSPGDPEAYRSRGVVYMKKGDLSTARADFQKSCALGSNESCEYLKSNRFQ